MSSPAPSFILFSSKSLLIMKFTTFILAPQVSVRRLKNFATPLPSPMPLLASACGSLHLAVNTRDWTFTSKISAMLGTHQKKTKTIRLSLFIKCRWPDSNRHGNYSPKDFKSFASANSATPANMCTPDPL